MFVVRHLIFCLSAIVIAASARANTGFWGPPNNLGTPVNSAADELSAVLCPSGLNLFFARTVTGQNDLYVASREGDTWGRPSALTSLNTPLYNETNLTFSRDGSRVYFATDRPGGPGGFDIWTSAWSGTAWLPPEPLGPAVNSPGDEWYAAESAEGLYLSARTSPGLNRGDILFAAGTFPGFAPRIPVTALATPHREMSVFPSPDGAALYVTADYPGSAGNDDLWLTQRSGEGWGAPRPLKCGINASDFEQYPSIDSGRRQLLFASYARPGGEGGADLYQATWHSLGDINADGSATTADIIHLVNYLFRTGPPPLDPMVEDLNCDQTISLVDVVYLISYVLRAGQAPCHACAP